MILTVIVVIELVQDIFEFMVSKNLFPSYFSYIKLSRVIRFSRMELQCVRRLRKIMASHVK